MQGLKTGFDQTLQPLIKEDICKQSLGIKDNFIPSLNQFSSICCAAC